MIYWIAFYLSLFSPLLPVTAGRRQRTLLWWYAVAGFLFDLGSTLLRMWYTAMHREINLSVAENIFVVMEFLLVSFYYRSRIFASTPAFYGTLAVAGTIYIASLITRTSHTLNLMGGAVFDFTCIVFAVAGFYSLLKQPQLLYLGRSSFFWVNIAFLTYCTGNFLVFLFADYLCQQNIHLMKNLWIFHDTMNVIFSIFVTIAFSVRNKSTL